MLDINVVAKIAEDTADEPQLERQREALEQCMKKVPDDQRALLVRASVTGANIRTGGAS